MAYKSGWFCRIGRQVTRGHTDRLLCRVHPQIGAQLPRIGSTTPTAKAARTTTTVKRKAMPASTFKCGTSSLWKFFSHLKDYKSGLSKGARQRSLATSLPVSRGAPLPPSAESVETFYPENNFSIFVFSLSFCIPRTKYPVDSPHCQGRPTLLLLNNFFAVTSVTRLGDF